MDDEEDRATPTAHEVGMSLDIMSEEELRERIALLKKEIERLEAAIAARAETRHAAEALFKF